jgi:phospholipase D1/2
MEALQGFRRVSRAHAQTSTRILLFRLSVAENEFFNQLEDDPSPEPLGQVPSAGRVERALDEQVTQQEPRAEDASTIFHSSKAHEETLAHLTNGHSRGGTSKGEKSITEKPTAPQASEKTNGSVFQDKGKKNRGEPPFTKQEREEKEALLNDLCGHLGQPLEFQYSAALQGLTSTH